MFTALKVSKYGGFCGLYFPAFRLNTEYLSAFSSAFSLNAGKHGPEKTPYLDTFHAVVTFIKPINGSSYHYSYKMSHSIVSMSLADPDYHCL